MKYPSVSSGVAAVNPKTPGIDYRYDRIGNMLRKESNIDHRENGLSVTHLGTMSYGAGLGPTGRKGRGDSRAGPHALSTVSADGGPGYEYDANGNVVQMGDVYFNWDIKNRLIRETGNTRVGGNHYDYLNRRVVATQMSKDGRVFDRSTYVNRYFEIRSGGEGVKYVWNADARLARTAQRIDKVGECIKLLRFQPGWNLFTLPLETSDEWLESGAVRIFEHLFCWDEARMRWSEAEGPAVLRGKVAWGFVGQEHQLLVPVKTRSEEGDQIRVSPSGWIVNLSGSVVFLPVFERESTVWVWDPEIAEWALRGHGILGHSEGARISLGPFGVAWIDGGSGFESDFDLAADLGTLFYHHDHLKSTAAATDQKGGVLELNNFFPFGGRSPIEKVSSRGGRYQFSQKESSITSGLYYFEARHLDSHAGRFFSYDPALTEEFRERIWNPQDLNPYSYSLNNPISYIDPSGEVVVTLIAASILAYKVYSAASTVSDIHQAYKAFDRDGPSSSEGWKKTAEIGAAWVGGKVVGKLGGKLAGRLLKKTKVDARLKHVDRGIAKTEKVIKNSGGRIVIDPKTKLDSYHIRDSLKFERTKLHNKQSHIEKLQEGSTVLGEKAGGDLGKSIVRPKAETSSESE